MLDRTPLQPLLRHRHPLLLQGPMGPFFARLADFLERCEQTVDKINFNGGDALFFRGPRAVDYAGTESAWPAWLTEFIRRRQTDAIVLFGQMRWMHVAACEIARDLGIPAYVFEEGYLRPDYVTLERGGVNGKSPLPRNADFYRRLPPFTVSRPVPTRQRFRNMAFFAVAYNLAAVTSKQRFPRYRHHRPIQPFLEGCRWIRGGLRKLARRWIERGTLNRLTSASQSRQWFLLPLQVHNDSQVRHHSTYESVETLIDEVIASFARHALPTHSLVIKHHPMDRAYRNYTRLIDRLSALHGVSDRVLYIHDQHLPTLLKHTRGVVTLNSTVGLQALFHGAPVLTLGDCLYAVPGLVSVRALDEFWREPGQVDTNLYVRFRNYLVRHTQLNASFYGEIPAFLQCPLPVSRLMPDARLPAQPAIPASVAIPTRSASTHSEKAGAA